MTRALFGTLLFALFLAAPAGAQRGTGGDTIPAGHMPPLGMCRVWIAGVPANKQAAPTDCATAVRNVPANGKVLFGDTTKVKTGTAVPKSTGTGPATVPSTKLPAGKLPGIPPGTPPGKVRPPGRDTTEHEPGTSS